MVRETKLSSDGGVESYPLTPMQQGMLFHRLQGGAPGVDIEQVICELHEKVGAAQFERAWREVIERHPALRTGFHWRDGEEPEQVVYPASRVRLDIYHAEFGSEHEARLGLEEYLVADRAQGFPTLNPPLVRVALLRAGPEHFWFVTTYHHLVLDARSMTLMFREALEIHDALKQDRPLNLPPAPSFRPFVEWLQARDYGASEEFWRGLLRGFGAPTLLPIAQSAAAGVPASRQPETPAATDTPGELAFRLTEPATLQLRMLAQKHEVTLNTLAQAAWAVVIGRYTGETDVVFGALRAGRKVPVEGADATIGLFINTVPVRVRLPDDAEIGPWLRELREQWVALREHEHTPLTKIQQWSDVAPGQSLFESIISYQEPAWDAALNALGGAWSHRRFDIRAQPNYPLAFEILSGLSLTVKLIFDRARFTGDSINRLLGHYRVVLEALGNGACATVGELPLLTDGERHELLVERNRTEQYYPHERCIHTLVEAHAAKFGERIAVTDAEDALTYGELNARANRLAQWLRRHHVGPDTPVAICMERSVEMAVAWLAVLKAGGAFVPLDPSYPKERLAFQLRDCATSVLLTQARHRHTLPALPPNIDVLDVSADGSGFCNESDQNPPATASSRNLAYVIYTSGSTGEPKGVAIEHCALMNLVTWHWRIYEITAADRATHLASPAFDASVWEIWPYLAAGASVHIPDEETRLSPVQLWRWMAEKRITVAFMPTPLAEAAMNEPWPHDMTLRALLTGGDKLKLRPPANFPCELINHYGPTESTVVATFGRVSKQGSDAWVPTIGRPIANTQVYVLDRAMRPVPVGVPGELFIGGSSLARGYWRRPELTAQKFVANPFAGNVGPALVCGELVESVAEPRRADKRQPYETEQRLYRTGDLVRWTAGGELDFLGRLDGQVKVRGCRIELGEIEATLQRHPSVRESVVVALSDERGQSQLVGYLVAPSGNVPASEGELIDFLREKLPAYMVPSACIFLDAWPLTPNGKIDRAALPAPMLRGSEGRTSFAAPRSSIEQTVAKVWAEVLGHAQVGVDDNFFDLGGHSLLAAQVVTRLNTLLQTSVSVRALFDQPMLAGFAREVEQGLDVHGLFRSPVHRVKRRVARPELELVPSTKILT